MYIVNTPRERIVPMRSRFKFLLSASTERYLALALTTCLLSGLMLSTASAQQHGRVVKPAVHSAKQIVQWKAPKRRTVVRPKSVVVRPNIVASRR